MRVRPLRERPEWIVDIAGYGALGVGLVGGFAPLAGMGFVLVAAAWPVHLVRWRRDRAAARREPATVSEFGRHRSKRRTHRRAA